MTLNTPVQFPRQFLMQSLQEIEASAFFLFRIDGEADIKTTLIQYCDSLEQDSELFIAAEAELDRLYENTPFFKRSKVLRCVDQVFREHAAPNAQALHALHNAQRYERFNPFKRLWRWLFGGIEYLNQLADSLNLVIRHMQGGLTDYKFSHLCRTLDDVRELQVYKGTLPTLEQSLWQRTFDSADDWDALKITFAEKLSFAHEEEMNQFFERCLELFKAQWQIENLGEKFVQKQIAKWSKFFSQDPKQAIYKEQFETWLATLVVKYVQHGDLSITDIQSWGQTNPIFFKFLSTDPQCEASLYTKLLQAIKTKTLSPDIARKIIRGECFIEDKGWSFPNQNKMDLKDLYLDLFAIIVEELDSKDFDNFSDLQQYLESLMTPEVLQDLDNICTHSELDEAINAQIENISFRIINNKQYTNLLSQENLVLVKSGNKQYWPAKDIVKNSIVSWVEQSKNPNDILRFMTAYHIQPLSCLDEDELKRKITHWPSYKSLAEEIAENPFEHDLNANLLSSLKYFLDRESLQTLVDKLNGWLEVSSLSQIDILSLKSTIFFLENQLTAVNGSVEFLNKLPEIKQILSLLMRLETTFLFHIPDVKKDHPQVQQLQLALTYLISAAKSENEFVNKIALNLIGLYWLILLNDFMNAVSRLDYKQLQYQPALQAQKNYFQVIRMLLSELNALIQDPVLNGFVNDIENLDHLVSCSMIFDLSKTINQLNKSDVNYERILAKFVKAASSLPVLGILKSLRLLHDASMNDSLKRKEYLINFKKSCAKLNELSATPQFCRDFVNNVVLKQVDYLKLSRGSIYLKTYFKHLIETLDLSSKLSEQELEAFKHWKDSVFEDFLSGIDRLFSKDAKRISRQLSEIEVFEQAVGKVIAERSDQSDSVSVLFLKDVQLFLEDKQKKDIQYAFKSDGKLQVSDMVLLRENHMSEYKEAQEKWFQDFRSQITNQVTEELWHFYGEFFDCPYTFIEISHMLSELNINIKTLIKEATSLETFKEILDGFYFLIYYGNLDSKLKFDQKVIPHWDKEHFSEQTRRYLGTVISSVQDKLLQGLESIHSIDELELRCTPNHELMLALAEFVEDKKAFNSIMEEKLSMIQRVYLQKLDLLKPSHVETVIYLSKLVSRLKNSEYNNEYAIKAYQSLEGYLTSNSTEDSVNHRILISSFCSVVEASDELNLQKLKLLELASSPVYLNSHQTLLNRLIKGEQTDWLSKLGLFKDENKIYLYHEYFDKLCMNYIRYWLKEADKNKTYQELAQDYSELTFEQHLELLAYIADRFRNNPEFQLNNFLGKDFAAQAVDFPERSYGSILYSERLKLLYNERDRQAVFQ